MNSEHMKDTCTLMMETHEEFIRIRSGIERLMLPVAQNCGLTPTQVAVLNLIRKTEEATVSKLFRALDFNQGNMSSLCKKLEQDGFIKRIKSSSDERKSYILLTEKGTAALKKIDEIFTFSEDACWLTEEEFKNAETALVTLKNAATKINKMLSITLDEQNGDNNA